ncbi:MAG: NusG domain II-containing protein [Methylophilaceae bacterium]|nr:NusG domain II-containing protein [Methylophilaceae bacterium]MDG1821104.1 NusG domain II-containing protein [Methylophilaceae bacterium]MDG2293348.1 NusG domain II-containing protein [Methylophilaceae bacterium]
MNKLKSQALIGDIFIIVTSAIAVVFLFKTLWSNVPASQLLIRQADQIIGTYDLEQTRELHIHGPLGESHISIEQGKVRFKQSPCNHQYCVHQGWLNRVGQVAICLPNQISLQLIGEKKPYDSLNY